MAAANSLDALFKRVYGDGTIKAVPKFAKIMKEVKLQDREKLGDMYVVPVMLQHEHGFTYGAHGAGAATLNAAIAGAVKQAQVRGSMIFLRSQLSYEDIFKAAKAGDAAFEAATSLVVENMQVSFAKRVELSFIHGQTGLGKVSAIDTGVITLTDASWAPGIWSGMKDCIIEAFDGLTATQTAHNGDLTITAVSISGKTVTVSGTSSAVVADDILSFNGARTATAFAECVGLDKILSTTSGDLFNISTTSYELWRANQVAVGGPISMLALMNGAAAAQNMGLMEDAVVYISTKRWNSLNADQAALRRYGAYSKTAENGSEQIKYHSVNGSLTIEAHPFYKEGSAHLIPNPSKRLVRVGASDITFRRPGMKDSIFLEIADTAGLELRAFSDQAIMATVPAQCANFTGITD